MKNPTWDSDEKEDDVVDMVAIPVARAELLPFDTRSNERGNTERKPKMRNKTRNVTLQKAIGSLLHSQ